MSDIHDSMAETLPELSHLECEVCTTKLDIGDVADRLANGWPKHCGFTMKLITKKQMEERTHENNRAT